MDSGKSWKCENFKGILGFDYYQVVTDNSQISIKNGNLYFSVIGGEGMCLDGNYMYNNAVLPR